MTQNLAPWDRWVRLVASCVLLGGAWYLQSVWLLAGAVILLWTSVAGWCPLYRLFGFATKQQQASGNPIAEGFAPVARRAVADVTAGKAALLDVRRDDEWLTGHAPMAVHLELSKIEAGQLPDIPKDRPLYVHCAAGARAAKAVELLSKAGWVHVANLGGLNDWKAAGGPIVTE